MSLKSIISTIKVKIEHYPVGSRMVFIIRKIGIVHMIHSIADSLRPCINEEYRIFVQEHRKDIEALKEMLADNRSIEVLEHVIQYRIDNKQSYLKGIIDKHQYFDQKVLPIAHDEVFVDGGAYVGDTLNEYLRVAKKSGEGYQHVYCWEPDEANIKELSRKNKKTKKLSIVKKGLWSSKGTLGFTNAGSAGSQISTEAEFAVDVDTIDNVHASDNVTFIKMDIEGAEQEALLGARNVICKHHPKLAICIYHKYEDLYEIPFMIKEMNPDYKLYIRHYSDTYAETVLYAVDESERTNEKTKNSI